MAQHDQQQGIDSRAAEQLRLQAQLQHRLPFRSEAYTLTLHLPPLRPGPPEGAAEQETPTAAGAGGGAGDYGRISAALPPLAGCLELRNLPHRLQQWFGTPAFLLLTPGSYSGRVLESEVR